MALKVVITIRKPKGTLWAKDNPKFDYVVPLINERFRAAEGAINFEVFLNGADECVRVELWETEEAYAKCYEGFPEFDILQDYYKSIGVNRVVEKFTVQ